MLSTILLLVSLLLHPERLESLLLDVPAKEGQVEDKRHPVTIDEEEEGQETMHSSLGDNVGVESVAEVNGVDVVTVIKCDQLLSHKAF